LALRPLQNPKTLLRPAPGVQRERIPSRQQEQKLERPPARGHGHLVRVHRGDGVRGPSIPLEQRAELRALPRVVLQTAVPQRSTALCELVGPPAQAEVERRFPLQPFRHREPCWTAAPHRNKPAARAEARADRRALPASFCGAASAHASIYACKAFNTEERVDSIGQTSARTIRDSQADSARM
jgi:hypothetical protein